LKKKKRCEGPAATPLGETRAPREEVVPCQHAEKKNQGGDQEERRKTRGKKEGKMVASEKKERRTRDLVAEAMPKQTTERGKRGIAGREPYQTEGRRK